MGPWPARGVRGPRASSPGSVLSSQFLALCEQHPALVVELARELLEFAGSASSTRSGGVMLTSVVRPAAPDPPAPPQEGPDVRLRRCPP